MTRSRSFVAFLLVAAFVIGVTSASANPGTTELISVDSAGNPANGSTYSGLLDVSSGGRWVVFDSFASNLVPGDTNGTSDVFVRDRLTGTTERVSVDSAETGADAASFVPAISADGRYVAFLSQATNLVADDEDFETDVFVRDRVAGTTERVGREGLDRVGISADGRFVVYNSFSSSLVPGDTNDGSDVFVYDRLTSATERVSVGSSGEEADVAGNSYIVQSLYPSISGDGRVVEFLSNATNLVPGDTNTSWDIFVHDRVTGGTERVSVDSAENESHDPNFPPSHIPSDSGSLSFDGRFVAFPSHAPDLVAGGSGGQQIFVRDRVVGTTELVSVGDGPGGPAAGPASISTDGRYVAFWSCFALVAADTNGFCDAYVRDRIAATTNVVSVSSNGGAGTDASLFAAIDATGRYVAFLSFAVNLVPGDINGLMDVFVHDTADDAVPPTVSAPSFTVNPKPVSATTVVSATASDDTALAGGEYFIDTDPGDGSGTPMALSGSTLSATIGTSLLPGVYTVGVRARDESGNWSAVAIALLVVYDPSGGYATGGGWLVPGGATSDPGDSLPGLDGAAKANFGFVVKYETGASTVPGGNLEFHYNVGRFHLRSTAMAWLVVTNSNWARFQGTATINGASAIYPFRVDARDSDKSGQPDRFVIRIWGTAANPDTDEALYTASGDVQGGDVVIHR